jgi:hypothetical protein
MQLILALHQPIEAAENDRTEQSTSDHFASPVTDERFIGGRLGRTAMIVSPLDVEVD